jgi:RHS repeat-associated protein
LIRASGTFAALNPIRFSSKYFDDEVGLSYYGYRYYNANFGRWISRDSIQERGGPNIYAFCINQTTRYVDPEGLDIWTWFGLDTGDGDATYMDSHGVYSDGPPPPPAAEPQNDADYEPPMNGLGVDNNFNGKTGGEVGWEMLKEAGVAVGSMLVPEERMLEWLSECRLARKLKRAEDAAKSAKLKPYGGPGGGHHVPAKSAFRGARNYDVNEALAIPNDELKRLGIDHDAVSGAQQTLYRAYAQTGAPLTWDAMQHIEATALIRSGMDPAMADATVKAAIDALKKAGVPGPSRVPWE